MPLPTLNLFSRPEISWGCSHFKADGALSLACQNPQLLPEPLLISRGSVIVRKRLANFVHQLKTSRLPRLQDQ